MYNFGRLIRKLQLSIVFQMAISSTPTQDENRRKKGQLPQTPVSSSTPGQDRNKARTRSPIRSRPTQSASLDDGTNGIAEEKQGTDMAWYEPTQVVSTRALGNVGGGKRKQQQQQSIAETTITALRSVVQRRVGHIATNVVITSLLGSSANLGPGGATYLVGPEHNSFRSSQCLRGLVQTRDCRKLNVDDCGDDNSLGATEMYTRIIIQNIIPRRIWDRQELKLYQIIQNMYEIIRHRRHGRNEPSGSDSHALMNPYFVFDVSEQYGFLSRPIVCVRCTLQKCHASYLLSFVASSGFSRA
jgi:hypothetical protein